MNTYFEEDFHSQKAEIAIRKSYASSKKWNWELPSWIRAVLHVASRVMGFAVEQCTNM